MSRTSEIALNTQIAEVLRRMNPLWRNYLKVEQTNVFLDHACLRPDILVEAPVFQPVVVETEYMPGRSVEHDASSRLGLVSLSSNQQIEQAIAVKLPASLREDQLELALRISQAEFEYAVLIGSVRATKRFPKEGWLKGYITDIARCIEYGMVSQRLIDESITELEQGVSQASQIVDWAVSKGHEFDVEFGRVLNQIPSQQTNRMAMTIVANALTFHETIAGTHGIPSLVAGVEGSLGLSKFELFEIWQRILHEVNYWPIFEVAIQLLNSIGSEYANQIIQSLTSVASKLAALGITSRLDLSGRMFQQLITDRKFLATFYTLPMSSTLLAEIAVGRMNIHWQDLDIYTDLRLADFSCGTGTLLSAAYHSILSRYRYAGGDDRQIHRDMLEDAIVAADIMPAAVHLCATQLASIHPSVTFNNTRVYTMPYGKPNSERSFSGTAVGSLDLIESDESMSLFATGRKQVRGARQATQTREVKVPHNSVDLVIMNPPFTRPTNHEVSSVPIPSFAGFQTTEDEQEAMSVRLRQIRHSLEEPAGHGNAGLASNFVDLAHRKVKLGGTLALVLPIAFVTGASWHNARNLILKRYADIVIVSIATQGSANRAFSADTSMAEVLLIATKSESNSHSSGEVLFVSLDHRPEGLLEAGEVASLINKVSPLIEMGRLTAGDQFLGSFIRANLKDGGCVSLRDSTLAKTMISLQSGQLYLPRHPKTLSIPVVPIASIGKRGLLHRDIGAKGEIQDRSRGPFNIVPIQSPTSYPVLWGHHIEMEHTLEVKPDAEGEVREARPTDAADVWQTATRLHYTLDFGLNSQRLGACLTPELTLGGRAWPNFKPKKTKWECLLVLWANSTLGLMCFWWLGTRQHRGRSTLTISRLEQLMSLDPSVLSNEKLDHAREVFNQLKAKPLLPANEAYRDETRQLIDKQVLIEILGLPESVLDPLADLRFRWCSEASVHGGKHSAP